MIRQISVVNLSDLGGYLGWCREVEVQVYILISSLKTYHPTFTFYPPPPDHWTCSFVCYFNSTWCIQSVHWAYHTHCHICPTRCSFPPESSEAIESEVPCPRTQHWNNVPRLNQAGFETARQTATSTERHAVTIAKGYGSQIYSGG